MVSALTIDVDITMQTHSAVNITVSSDACMDTLNRVLGDQKVAVVSLAEFTPELVSALVGFTFPGILEKSGSGVIKAQVFPIEDVSAMVVPEADVPAVVVDTGHLFCGAAAEVMARLVEIVEGNGSAESQTSDSPESTVTAEAPKANQESPDDTGVNEAEGSAEEISADVSSTEDEAVN